jgi:hypothetical protein
MSEETKPAETLPIKVDTKNIVTLIQTNVPEMMTIRAKAVARMSQITAIEDEDDVEIVNKVLVNAKGAFDRVMELRKGVTDITDDLKKELMLPEKEITEHGVRIRGILQQFQQAELDKKKKIEEEAENRKKKENHKVDLEAQVKKNLSKMVIDITVEADEWSKKFWDNTTVADFDSRQKQFMGLKPSLKADRYNLQFNPTYNRSIITKEEYDAFITSLKERKDYSYAEWTMRVIELVTATLNPWRARIDEIKAEKIEIEKANGEKKAQLEADKKARDDAEEKRKKEAFDKLQKQAESTIAEEAEIGKMSNEFVKQGTIEQAGDKGLIKYVLKFTDREKQMKAFATIIAHCMSHKDFPGFQKKDKNKAPVVDDKNRPEYIDAVQWWINFFLAKCDADIDGTQLFEDSKVIVRK